MRTGLSAGMQQAAGIPVGLARLSPSCSHRAAQTRTATCWGDWATLDSAGSAVELHKASPAPFSGSCFHLPGPSYQPCTEMGGQASHHGQPLPATGRVPWPAHVVSVPEPEAELLQESEWDVVTTAAADGAAAAAAVGVEQDVPPPVPDDVKKSVRPPSGMPSGSNAQESIIWLRVYAKIGFRGMVPLPGSLHLANSSGFLPDIEIGADPLQEPETDFGVIPVFFVSNSMSVPVQDLTWLMTDFDVSRGFFSLGGFDFTDKLPPRKFEQLLQLYQVFQSIDVQEVHCWRIRACLQCIQRTLRDLACKPRQEGKNNSEHVVQYGHVLAWAKMKRLRFFFVGEDKDYPFPDDWTDDKMTAMGLDIVAALKNLGKSLGLRVVDESPPDILQAVRAKSEKSVVVVDRDNWHLLNTIYPDLYLKHWQAPEGFTPFFFSERLMKFSKFITIVEEMPVGNETWFPNLGGQALS